MNGKCEEHHSGRKAGIVLIEYQEASFLQDDIDEICLLSTGPGDRL